MMFVTSAKYLFVFLVILNTVFAEESTTKIPENTVPDLASEANMKDVHIITYKFTVYYVFRNKKLNWYEAFAQCKSNGMVLASPSTKEMNEHLTEALKAKNLLEGNKNDYWISATDLGAKETWVWMSTGKPMTYSNWHANEPNNGGASDSELEHCAEIRTTTSRTAWNDWYCSIEQYYICEK